MIIVSITGPRMSDALEQVGSSEAWADMFEFRFDLIRNPELAMLLLSTRKPVIATCRPVWEGGEFRGSEVPAWSYLPPPRLLGAEYVDIEIGAGRRALDAVPRATERKRRHRLLPSPARCPLQCRSVYESV